MTDSTINLQNLQNLRSMQRFARIPALVSAAHCQELMMLATSPERNAVTTLDTEKVCASLYGSDENASGKPFIFSGGIALIPVYGALLHRDPWCDRWATGYDYIASRLGAALGDPDVKGILWDINSYGGHVAGNFELCDLIYEARTRKPMAAVVDNRALSGGYSIASAVGKTYVTPSSDIGSVGVVMLHMSYEKMMEDFGVKPTFVFAGKHKVDGNPYEDLPDDVREAFQASIERSYDSFVSLVARNRGIEPDAVRATEARSYDAQEAVNLGLVDAVMPPRAAYAAFLSEVSNATSAKTTSGVKKMSDETANKNAAGGDGDEAARLDAARKEGAKQAQARVASILTCDEAKKRPKLANHLALNTAMSVEDAKSLLSVSAEEAAPEPSAQPQVAPGSGALAAAMAADEGKVAGRGGQDDHGDGQLDRAARIAANHRIACGRQ